MNSKSALFIYPFINRSTFHLFFQNCVAYDTLLFFLNHLHSLKRSHFFIYLSQAKSKLRSWHDQIKIYAYTAHGWHTARYTNIYRRKWIPVTKVILATVQLLTPIISCRLKGSLDFPDSRWLITAVTDMSRNWHLSAVPSVLWRVPIYIIMVNGVYCGNHKGRLL